MEPKFRVAIIVPYRDRKAHLDRFVQHFAKLQQKNGGQFEVFVIEQLPKGKFNRGILLNAGFAIASNMGQYDRYIFHDVDSYPTQSLYKQYFAFPDRTVHYASPYLGYKYSYHTFYGGVCAYTSSDYVRVNGFPNTFMGWGGEDDAVLMRTVNNNITIWRPRQGKYILADHDSPDASEKIDKQSQKELYDRANWKRDGVVQIMSGEDIRGADGVKVSNVRYCQNTAPLDGKAFKPLTKLVSDFRPPTKRGGATTKDAFKMYYFGIDWDVRSCKKSLTNSLMSRIGLTSGAQAAKC
jgi:hypothetical protein